MPSDQRVLRFPHRRSVGTVFVADESQPEEWELLSQVRGLIVAPENQPIKWTWLEEARGNVSIPAGVKVKLKISGSGSGSLAPIKTLAADDLHTLDLSRSEIIDVSLSHIQNLTSLKVLELTSTNVTDAALLHLPGLKNLQGLGLSHCQISGQGLRNLAGLNSLRELWLSGADLIDDEMQYLQQFTNLVQLGLSGTRISDKGLEKLSPLKQLMRLYLFNTQVTRPGAENFRTIVPGCRVKWKARINDEISTIGDLSSAIGSSLTSNIAENTELPGGLLDILSSADDSAEQDIASSSANSSSNPNSAYSQKSLNSSSQVFSDPSSEEQKDSSLPHNAHAARSRHARTTHHQLPKMSSNPTQDFNIEQIGEPELADSDAPLLDDAQFWQIIDSFNWEQEGIDNAVMEPAIQHLSTLSKKDICAFADILSEKLHALDAEKFARNIGCSSFTDGDDYFSRQWFVSSRCCVVANGQKFYEDVLANPEKMPKELEFDAILQLPAKAYERKTTKKFSYLPRFNYETFANKSGWK